MSSPRSAAVLPIPPRESRRGAAGAAYRWLRGEILAGALPPGAPLSENEVAQRLGVSRTPVREAFIRLENEGLLAVTPQVGTTVAPIDLEQVADGQFLRESIETRTVAMAATAATARDAADLKALLRDQGRAVAKHDQAGFLVLDDKLHQRLVTIAGRPRVWHTIEDLKAQLDRVRVLSLGDARWLAAIHAQHEEIVEAVLAGRPDDAALAMGRHLRAVFASIDTIAVAHPEYFRGAPGKPARQAPDVKPPGRTGGNP